jgi:hypothetical protein
VQGCNQAKAGMSHRALDKLVSVPGRAPIASKGGKSCVDERWQAKAVVTVVMRQEDVRHLGWAEAKRRKLIR